MHEYSIRLPVAASVGRYRCYVSAYDSMRSISLFESFNGKTQQLWCKLRIHIKTLQLSSAFTFHRYVALIKTVLFRKKGMKFGHGVCMPMRVRVCRAVCFTWLSTRISEKKNKQTNIETPSDPNSQLECDPNIACTLELNFSMLIHAHSMPSIVLLWLLLLLFPVHVVSMHG